MASPDAILVPADRTANERTTIEVGLEESKPKPHNLRLVVGDVATESGRSARGDALLKPDAGFDWGRERDQFVFWRATLSQSPNSRDTVANLVPRVQSETPEQRFVALANRWRSETEYAPAIEASVIHPAYQMIMAMGPSVIPLILNELSREPDDWFWALYFLSGGCNPVAKDHAGEIDKMAQDWLSWGRNEGYRVDGAY